MSRFKAVLAIAAASFFVSMSALGAGEVSVVLQPSHPPPYYTGEQITVDVWLHSEWANQANFRIIQFDFESSNPAISLSPQFSFDYPGVSPPRFYVESPNLPIPQTSFLTEIGCVPWCECIICFPAGAFIHMGFVSAHLPNVAGQYTLDAMERTNPDQQHGAMLALEDYTVWRAFTGEIVGGSYSFDVLQAPQIPATPEWGIVMIAANVIACGRNILSVRA